MRRVIDERRRLRRSLGAHQGGAGSVFNSGDCLAFATKEFCHVPNTGAMHHQVTKIICDPFGNPKTASVCRTRKVPWSKLDRSKSFHVPNMKKLVCHRSQCAGVNAAFA